MTSYHRVLDVFGRSVNDKSMECDYDIHPWDILVDGERWAGKIRLVGYVDVFFVICYSGASCFDHGLMIFKDDDAIRHMLKVNGIQPEAIHLDVVNTKKVEQKKEPPKYYSFKGAPGALDFTVTGLGMPLGLKTAYPRSSLQVHTIKVRKGRDTIMKNQMRRGLKQHNTADLIQDALRVTIITEAQVLGFCMRETLGGSVTHDLTNKLNNVSMGGGRDVALAGEAK